MECFSSFIHFLSEKNRLFVKGNTFGFIVLLVGGNIVRTPNYAGYVTRNIID